MVSPSPEARPARRPPEVELLLSCARSRIDPIAAERVRKALKEAIDWERLVEAASRHGTAPLLYWNLSRLGCNGIPESTLSRLKGAFNAIALWNLSLTGELLKLLKLFGDVGIRALPIKGPALAATAYGNLSLRTFSDLDILMAMDDIRRAKEVLISQGYHAKLELTASEEASYLRSHHDYKFVHGDGRIVVELQTGITQWSFAFPIDFEDLWQRREEMTLAGVSVLNLPTEDLLIILCVHGAKHHWDQLKWISDIAELVDANSGRIDWHRLMNQARRQGGERMLLLGLFLAHDLVGARLPEQVSQKIHNDLQVKALADCVSARLFCDVSDTPRSSEERPFFYWEVRERLRDKLAIAWRYFPEYFWRGIVPNKKDHEFLHLPPFLSLGYYVVHPFRMVLEGWSSFRQRSRKPGE
jgi:hypothetical protein